MYCPKCGQNISYVAGQEYCGRCGQKLLPDEVSEPSVQSFSNSTVEGSLESQSSGGLGDESQTDSPWEDEQSVGFINGLLLTIKRTLFKPYLFFRYMPRTGGHSLPVLYYLILGISGAILGLISETFVESPVMTHSNLMRQMSLASVLILPALLVFELYLGSLALHVSMMIFAAKKEGFETTLRIMAYSSGPNVFYAIPLIGWLIAAVWTFWLTVVGIREISVVSTARAFLAAIAPSFLVVALLFTFLVFFIGLVGLSGLY
ncbi:MAG: YIP1 family protein [Desulfomonilaceae bacterium]